MSQKQWSRLELGDVSVLDRRLLIRLGEIFETPLATGELNQWLHSFGYRPHIMPLLPLPPNHRELLSATGGHPATILDVGRYIRYANQLMERLYAFSINDLVGIRQNWLWHYFHPEGLVYHTYSPDSRKRLLTRLFWDWQPYFNEPWNRSLRQQLEAELHLSWSDLAEELRIPSEPWAAPTSEIVTVWFSPSSQALEFRAESVSIPHRPDLFAVVYRPRNLAAITWTESAP